jgi:hypothetical protein
LDLDRVEKVIVEVGEALEASFGLPTLTPSVVRWLEECPGVRRLIDVGRPGWT